MAHISKDIELDAEKQNHEKMEENHMKCEEAEVDEKCDRIIYGVNDNPSWYLAMLLGFQQYLTMFGSTLSIPFLLAPAMCIDPDDPARGQFVSTIIFVSGIVTFIQSTVGIRLPIVQGGTFSLLVPTMAVLSLDKWKCPSKEYISTRNTSSEEIWQPRMREIQGAIMVASLFEVVIGLSGIMGLVIRFITPLTIAPTVTLVGLALFPVAAAEAGKHWGISFMVFALIVLFSQYLRNFSCPFPSYSRTKRFYISWLPLFKLFPVLLAIIVVWIFCAILTAADVVDKNSYIRTDTNDIIAKTSWFRVPYPGQWGLPTVTLAAVFGMLAGIISGMIESIGDYYACAKLSGASAPPVHAINRGLLIEGLGSILAAAFGSGNGTTSYSENIGAIGVTKVASRRVVQWSSVIMIVFGMLGKFCASFVTIPVPLIGGVYCAMFGMIAAVGLSTLQYVNLNSPRNLFILGTSLLLGLAIPTWMKSQQDLTLVSSSATVDQLIKVLLSTNMLVGGFIGFILDNTVPGTAEERGIQKWRQTNQSDNKDNTLAADCYDFPCGMNFLSRHRIFEKIPICPTFKGFDFKLQTSMRNAFKTKEKPEAV